ncbi:MAG TPA: hypothetical protein VIE65_23525 [Methylobacter sp.]|jgi:hypothetical protein
MKRWNFEQDADGRGVIRHNARPRFSAYWTSGTAKMPMPLEPCWSDLGSGKDDCLHLYGVQWLDGRLPDAPAFGRLMQEAAKVIDTWIVSRL